MRKHQTRRRQQRLVDTLDSLLPAKLDPSILVYDETGDVARWIREAHPSATIWNRWSVGAVRGQTGPPSTKYQTAIMRLPHSKDAFTFALHMMAGRLAPGAQIWICGANDEGIKSTTKRMAPLFDEPETVGVKNHCRLLRGRRSDSVALDQVDDWWAHRPLTIGGESLDWYSLPGVFAQGRLDPATALLLDHLPELHPGMDVLDFACGTGIIAWSCLKRQNEISMTVSDADSLAITSAGRNLGNVRLVQSDGWHSFGHQTFDLIISNPPIHRGKSEDHSILDKLIEGAKIRLNKGGQLLIVGQGRLQLESRLKAMYRKPSCIAKTTRFQIWSSR